MSIKPHGFLGGFLSTFICFCATALSYRVLYFVVKKIKKEKKCRGTICVIVAHWKFNVLKIGISSLLGQIFF